MGVKGMQKQYGRVRMSQMNFASSIVTRLVTMVTSFVSRTVFVKTLGAEYLGLGGLFGNIFSVISLCELGLGAAIAQSLYKPLAIGDDRKTAAVVAYYSRCTRIIAVITLLLSLCAFPFLGNIIKSEIDAGEIRAAFLMFSLHTVVSYLLLPKRTLIVCDQKMYVTSAFRSVFSVIALFSQIVALEMTGSYLVYLAIRIVVIVAEDVAVNIYADKNYSCLGNVSYVDREYKKSIFSNVRALMWHKMGGTLSRSTDSLLLTLFVGLAGMGKYSNYALVIGTVGSFFDAAVGAVSASVGNLGAGDRGKKSEWIMRKMYFINFWLVTSGACVLICCVNPVVRLWLGEEMCFSNTECAVIVASFFASCIRDPVQIFLNTYGLFRQSRFIPVLRAAANLVLSVILVKKIGVAGVFLGTVLSTLLVPMPLEVAVLYKYGFSMSPREFVKKELLPYLFFSPLCGAACFALTIKIPVSATGVAVRVAVSLIVSNCLMYLCFCACPLYGECFEMVSGMGRRMLKRDK